jgi:7-cyano-7-deazaguanine synthase
MDSTVALYDQIYSEREVVKAVSFNYGQRHKKELNYAARTCNKLGIDHSVIDLYQSGLTELLASSGSSLVSDTDVPEGHYAEDNMKATVVPNRNMIMLSIAGGIAVATGANRIVTAVHAGDHFIYPDGRPDFIEAVDRALRVGNDGFSQFSAYALLTPYMHRSKAWIAWRGVEVAKSDPFSYDTFPFEETWSCYQGGEIHCGKCGTCVERLEAIAGAARDLNCDVAEVDHTQYANTEFWKTQVNWEE